MTNLAVTTILSNYHHFDLDFWLSYKTLEKMHPNFDSIKLNLLKANRIDKKYLEGIDPLLFDIERSLLAEEWKTKNEEAKRIGTTTHEYIHNLFCTDLSAVKREFSVDTETYKVLQLEAFKSCSSGIFVEHRMEIPLDEEFLLVGIPDCFIIHDGVVDILDWKTNEKLSFRSMFQAGKGHTKRMKYPLSALDDCEGIRYQLLLSLYMWMILQLRPDLKPGTLKIVWINDNKVKKVFPVEYLGEVVDKLIKWHLKNVKLNRALLACRELEY